MGYFWQFWTTVDSFELLVATLDNFGLIKATLDNFGVKIRKQRVAENNRGYQSAAEGRRCCGVL